MWNLVGVYVRDVPAAAAELENKIGLEPIEVMDDFAILSSHWLVPDWPTWEIDSRSDGPAGRPALSNPMRLHVAGDMPAASEIAGPEGLRITRVPAEDGEPACPSITRVDLKALNVEATEKFYTDVIGLTAAPYERGIALWSQPRTPLVLERAAHPRRSPPAEPARAQLWIGFETPDISRALRWFEERAVPILQEPKLRRWGGTDMVVSDPDGNPVWIRQDHVPNWLRRFHHGRIFGGYDRECAGGEH